MSSIEVAKILKLVDDSLWGKMEMRNAGQCGIIFHIAPHTQNIENYNSQLILGKLWFEITREKQNTMSSKEGTTASAICEVRRR